MNEMYFFSDGIHEIIPLCQPIFIIPFLIVILSFLDSTLGWTSLTRILFFFFILLFFLVVWLCYILLFSSRFQKKEKVRKSLDTVVTDGKQEHSTGTSATPTTPTTPTSPATSTIIKEPKSALKISTKSNQTLAHGNIPLS